MRAQEDRSFSVVSSVGDQGINDLPPPFFVLIHFPADPFIRKECLDVELAQGMCKLDKAFVVLHLVIDCFENVEDLVGISLRVCKARKLIARDCAELRLQVLVGSQVNVKPVAPCLDILSQRKDPVDVLEDVLEGVRVVMLELQYFLRGFLHGAWSSAGIFETAWWCDGQRSGYRHHRPS